MRLKDKQTGEVGNYTIVNRVGKHCVGVAKDGDVDNPIFFDSMAELNERFEDAPEEKKYGGRVPKEDDEYWVVCCDGSLTRFEWNDDGVDGAKCSSAVWFEAGSAFWTEEEAEKEAARRKAYVILKEDTKGFKQDWGHNSLGEYKGHSYGVYYCRPSRRFLVNQCGTHEVQDGIRFATEEDAKASIKAHEKEWRAWLGVEQ